MSDDFLDMYIYYVENIRKNFKWQVVLMDIASSYNYWIKVVFELHKI